MNILYIHGYGSSYDPENPKVKSLKKYGEVTGVTVDYSSGPADVLAEIAHAAVDCDLIVGTSMGGWAAIITAARYNKEFIAINPCLDPGQSLKKYIGKEISYSGDKKKTLTEDTCLLYNNFKIDKEFNLGGIIKNGTVAVAYDDDVIDAHATIDVMKWHNVKILMSERGGHRFSNIDPVLNSWNELKGNNVINKMMIES